MSLDENEEAHLPSRQAVVRRIEKLWESKGVGAPLVEPTGETFLDRYRIIEFLGAGAFGVVYRVLDLTMEREVALKLPRAEVQVEEELQKRFANEVRLAAKLEHPGIVKLYEAKLEPPICFFTSEFCEGSDLAKWMRQRSEGGQRCADWQNVVRFIAKVAEATDYAHQQGVYHRDLKPANILLAPRESPVEEAETCLDHFEPKLSDFGMAKFVDLTTTQNLSSFIAGTPLYMAPEQFLNQQQVDHLPAADVYSLGVILFELLAGKAPFVGTTYAEILDAHRSAKPLRLSKLNQEVPKSLQTICERCLEKDPAARYQTAGELAEDLKAVAANKEAKIRRTSLWERFRWWAKQPARISFAGWYTIISALTFGFWFLAAALMAPLFMELTVEDLQGVWRDVAEILCLRVPLYCIMAWHVIKFRRWAIWLAVVSTIVRVYTGILMLGQPLYFTELYREEGIASWVDHTVVLISILTQLVLFLLALYADFAIRKSKRNAVA